MEQKDWNVEVRDDELFDTLRGIWREVLGIEDVALDDNLFVLGGDSLLATVIASKAERAGVWLTANDVLQHSTLGELCENAHWIRRSQSEISQHIESTPPFALTPIQHWFFSQDFSNPHHWNVSLTLDADHGLNKELLGRAASEVAVHHEALRSRFVFGQDGFRQWISPIDNSEEFLSVCDLRGLKANAQQRMILSHSKRIQESLNIYDGPVFRLVCYDMGSRLVIFLVAHHLVCDAWSLAIIVSDLDRFYRQLLAGKQLKYPFKTASIKQWSETLNSYGQSYDLIEGDIGQFWRSSNLHSDHYQSSMGNLNVNDNVEGLVVTTSNSLPRDSSRLLITRGNALYGSPEPPLLTALISSCKHFLSGNELWILMVHHGRMQMFGDLDVSRTVGWFMFNYPLKVHCDPTADVIQQMDGIASTLKSMPNKGFDYGILKWLTRASHVRDRMELYPDPHVSFNYIGDSQFYTNSSTIFRLSSQEMWADRAAHNQRNSLVLNYWVDVIEDGCLRLNVREHKNLLLPTAISEIPNKFLTTLGEISSRQ